LLSGVSKTAVLTLRARAEEHRRPDRKYEDPKAVEWLAKTAWPSELDLWFQPTIQSLLALRAHEIDGLIRRWASGVRSPVIVELGCGLSTRFDRLRGAGAVRWIDLDLPEVIAFRESLEPWGDLAGHEHIARSVLDRSWIDALAGVDPRNLCLVAEGLLYYLPRAEVDRLFADLDAKLAGAVAVFDVLGTYDFQVTRGNARTAGTDILWMVEPPFERIFAELALEVVPGFEPLAMMHEAIDLYWPRFGGLRHWAMKKLARINVLAAKRSGTVFGRLRA
jgi:O-methyltransferase involved in polyketide biosynthesis